MIRLPFIFARGFVAAETLTETLPVVQRLADRGMLTTIDLLGEHVTSKSLALRARDAYIHLLHALSAHPNLERNISIKLSMIGQIIDEDFCHENLCLLLDEARSLKAFVRLDMEGTSILNSTLRIFESTFSDYPENVGTVLQAYLKRTPKDVEHMCKLGARVRLCKGAYQESPQVALQRMPDIRAQFLTCMRTLLRHGNYAAIATHDDTLIHETMSFAQRQKISPSKYEFQMLYGLRQKTQEAIASRGYNMRIYTPYGKMWLPYYVRRLRERPENVTFLLRNILRS
ncbi:MAG: proline dehydrogenase family protein [Bacteroidetes bacterium]|nr:proline dehydrogenase family protein [Bacteroidota bacterium]